MADEETPRSPNKFVLAEMPEGAPPEMVTVPEFQRRNLQLNQQGKQSLVLEVL